MPNGVTIAVTVLVVVVVVVCRGKKVNNVSVIACGVIVMVVSISEKLVATLRVEVVVNVVDTMFVFVIVIVDCAKTTAVVVKTVMVERGSAQFGRA